MAEWVGLISVGLGDLLLSVFRPPHHADRAPYNKYYQFQVGMVKGMVISKLRAFGPGGDQLKSPTAGEDLRIYHLLPPQKNPGLKVNFQGL